MGYVYALRNKKTLKIDYVGSTTNLTTRFSQLFSHPKSKVRGKRDRYGIEIIRLAKVPDLRVFEHRIIRAYKGRGQCRLNKVIRIGCAVRCVETGQRFPTMRDVANVLGIARHRLARAFARGAEKAVLRRMTFERIWDY